VAVHPSAVAVNWAEMFDKIPQRIWEQRGGHNCHVTRNTSLILLW
jgi:hypothetical protein